MASSPAECVFVSCTGITPFLPVLDKCECGSVRKIKHAASAYGELLVVKFRRYDGQGKKTKESSQATAEIVVDEVEGDEVTQVTYSLVASVSSKKGSAIENTQFESITFRNWGTHTQGTPKWVTAVHDTPPTTKGVPFKTSNTKLYVAFYSRVREGAHPTIDIESLDPENTVVLPQIPQPLPPTPLNPPRHLPATAVWGGSTELMLACYDSLPEGSDVGRPRLPRQLDDAMRTTGISCQLQVGWSQRDPHSCGFAALRVLESYASGVLPPTLPTHADALRLLGYVDPTDLDPRDVPTLEAARTAVRDTPSNPIFKESMRLSSSVAAGVAKGLGRKFSVGVAFHAGCLKYRLVSTLDCFASHPLHLIFNTHREHFYCVVAPNNTSTVQLEGKSNALADMMKTSKLTAQLDVQEQMRKKKDVAIRGLFTCKSGFWTCTVCAQFKETLAREFGDEKCLTFARGEVKKQRSEGRELAKLRSHVGHAPHMRATELLDRRDSSVPTPTPLPSFNIRDCRPSVKATPYQQTAITNLCINVVTLSEMSSGLGRLAALVRDDRLKLVPTLQTHHSRYTAEELHLIGADLLQMENRMKLRLMRAVVVILDGSTFGKLDLLVVFIRGLVRSDGKWVLEDVLLGVDDLPEADADNHLLIVKKMLREQELTEWAKCAIFGLASDEAATNGALCSLLEKWLGRSIIALGDAAHIFAHAGKKIAKEKVVVEVCRAITQLGNIFKKSTKMHKKLIAADSSARVFPVEHKIRWASATKQRLEVATSNMKASLTVLRKEKPPRPVFYQIVERSFQHKLSFLLDLFDVLGSGSESLQTHGLTLESMHRVFRLSMVSLGILKEHKGKYEVAFLAVVKDAQYVAHDEFANWRSRLCVAVRVELKSRWRGYTGRKIAGFFTWQKNDVSGGVLDYLCGKLGYAAEERYTLMLEWRKVQMKINVGESGREHALRFAVDLEGTSLGFVLELLLSLSPSSCVAESAFSRISFSRSRHRRKMGVKRTRTELTYALCIKDKNEKERLEFCRRMKDVFLKKARCFVPRETTPQETLPSLDDFFDGLNLPEDESSEEEDDADDQGDALSLGESLASQDDVEDLPEYVHKVTFNLPEVGGAPPGVVPPVFLSCNDDASAGQDEHEGTQKLTGKRPRGGDDASPAPKRHCSEVVEEGDEEDEWGYCPMNDGPFSSEDE